MKNVSRIPEEHEEILRVPDTGNHFSVSRRRVHSHSARINFVKTYTSEICSFFYRWIAWPRSNAINESFMGCLVNHVGNYKVYFTNAGR